MKTVMSIVCWAVAALAASAPPGLATELIVRLGNAPARGGLVFQVYDSANAFGDFRDPSLEVAVAARGDGDYPIGDLPVADLAVLVYLDENGNGLLDKNFVGIPTEPLGISNNYRPKGPPSFERARFRLAGVEARTIDIELFRLLGERGRLGVGLGAIGRSSPYVESDQSVLRVIPAITYSGKRLQWFGPSLRYGLAGSGKLRLALTASYRIGVYEERDSPVLSGLGDREDALLAGLGLEYEMPGGVDLGIGYLHDVFDRIGGGEATLELSKGFQAGVVRVEPQLSAHWSSRSLSHHDFGVPASAVEPGRAAYELGSTVSYELGLGGFFELGDAWRLAASLAAEFLDDDVERSPIVADDTVIKGFAGLVYVF
jgi:outer membrane protein